jgi:hypothetical protein
MKPQRFLLILPLFLFSFKSYSQSFQITSPLLEFDGTQLQISYDVINDNQSDQFYVWVEVFKNNGEVISVKSLTGDIGNIKSGKDKKITWVPAKDAVYLDEEVSVEVKAEKYIKSFNKSSVMLMSAALPGLGQTKIKGKPWWLAGAVAYGALAGGFIVHRNYLNTYDSYRIEEDPFKRKDLFAQTQKQMNLSSALIISGAVIWATNLVWVAITPNKYKPLQNVKLSLDRSPGPYNGTTLLSFRLNF